MSDWNLMCDKKPELDSKFIAAYDFGCSAFRMDKHGGLHEKCECSNVWDVIELEQLNNYKYWSYLPDDFKFFGEE